MMDTLPGAEAVLAGVDLTKTDRVNLLAAWRSIANAGIDAQLKVLDGFLGARRMSWPWFDDCRQRFEGMGFYPDDRGWNVFNKGEGEPEPVSLDDALNWIGPKEARALLKASGVKGVGRKNVDAYDALCRHLPFEVWRPCAIANWREAEAARVAGPGEDEIERAKRWLLLMAMSTADYIADRIEQVSEAGYAPCVDLDSPFAQAMMNAPSPFAPHPGMPPFYPGDRSGISRERTNRMQTAREEPTMKIEGVDQFAQAVGRVGKRLEGFGRGAEKAGAAATRFGLRLMLAGLLLGIVIMLLW